MDDGSTDGSVETLKALAARDASVVFVELSRNFGQQKAFFAGMEKARGDVIITLDGDFQYGPECILDLADKVMEGYDVVSGLRSKRQDPWFSRISSSIGQFFIRRSLRAPIRDFGAVKAFSRFLADKIIQYANYCVIPYGMAYALTNRSAEIPVRHLPRPSGRSKWNFTKRLHMYFDLFLAFSPYEATSLIKIGSYCVAAGFLALAVMLYFFVVHRLFFFHSFTAVFSLALMVVGAGLVFASFFLSFLLRIYRQLVWRGQCYVLRETHPTQAPVSSVKALP